MRLSFWNELQKFLLDEGNFHRYDMAAKSAAERGKSIESFSEWAANQVREMFPGAFGGKGRGR